LNVEYFYRYKDDNHGPQYIGTFPVGKPVQIPLATDLDRDIVVTTRSRGPIGQQQINDIRDAPSLTIQSEREQRQPVIGQMGASTYLKAIIGVSYFPRHMKTRRILVATDEEFEDIVAEWYQDIDREEAETPRLSEQFSIQRLSPTSGTATYYIKVAHASFSTAIAKEATYQEKLEGLRWGPDSEVLEITLADNNGNGGSSGAFNPFTATFQGYGSGASGLLFSVPMPGDNSGGVTGTSNGFADQVALWEADDTLSFRLGIQADRPRGMLKANGFTGTVGAINAKVDYRASGSSTATTGNMSSGSNVLIVPSSTDFFVDQGITVAGAGPSGATLYSTVQSISTDGLTITLNHSASSPVTGATVNHDDTAAIQAAIDAATSVGRAIHIPAGIYRVRTLQLLDYYWHLYGEGPGRSVLQAAEANQPVIEITNQQAHTITIENLAIVGAGVSSGSSGHGIYVHDNDFDAFNIVLRNLRVADCGGRGVYLAQHFTTLLERVDVRNCGGNAIELQGNNTCRLANCYVADVPAGKAGYRIYNGHPLFESCNGVDSAGSWGVFGKSAAEDGADNFCFPVFLNCNVEGWGLGANAVDGIRIKNGFGHFLSTTWFAGATGTNLRALRQDFVDANWNSIIDAACQFYAPNGATQWANSQPVHSNGAPFIQFGALLTQYYDMGASAVRTLPTIKSNLIAGSSNVATWLSRAKIEALEASNLVGDLTGGVDFGGNVARVLLKAGTAGRPPLANVDDDDTGVYWGTNEIGLTINGSGKYSFHQNYFRVDAPIGVNTFPSAGYSFHSVNGGALVVAASGATIPTLELRGGVNTHLFVNDT
ncbi:MAG TPA: right-handed parallel beta-helix repeat-containing protein, partial [Blastocatellia bacterium]